MTRKIAILLAVGSLVLAAACDGDNKSEAKGAAPASSASTTAPGATTPTPSAPTTPQATPTEPKISNSRQIIMIDPDGKRYTFRTMVQMAAGMRATMGKNAPPDFCAMSYKQGVEEGGTFPAGREAFMAACQEGWRKGA